jgi:hypothetical protein
MVIGGVLLKSSWHVVSYVCLFLGGLLPATGGDLAMAKNKDFWKQCYIQYAMISELAAAIYEVLVSSGDSDEGEFDMDMVFLKHLEFFIVSRVFFCAAFIATVVFGHEMWSDICELKNVDIRYSMASFISDIVSQFGYFISTYAYLCYYQVSLVHASEMSLSQFFNLLLAYSLKRYFNLGKEASLSNIEVKLLSFVMITIGLYLAVL